MAHQNKGLDGFGYLDFNFCFCTSKHSANFKCIQNDVVKYFYNNFDTIEDVQLVWKKPETYNSFVESPKLSKAEMKSRKNRIIQKIVDDQRCLEKNPEIDTPILIFKRDFTARKQISLYPIFLKLQDWQIPLFKFFQDDVYSSAISPAPTNRPFDNECRYNKRNLIACPSNCIGERYNGGCSNLEIRTVIKMPLDKIDLVFLKSYPGKGLGVEAARDIDAGQVLLTYTGEVVDADACLDDTYAHDLDKELGLKLESNNKGSIGRFVNTTHEESELNVEYNQWSVDSKWRLVIQATKNIAEGTELLVKYGDSEEYDIPDCVCTKCSRDRNDDPPEAIYVV